MIAEAKQDRPHYHKVEKRSFDHSRDDQLKIVVDEESEDLGRTVALHIAARNYDVARLVLDRAEREFEAATFHPTRTTDVALADMGLQERTVVRLYDSRFRTLADLLACSDDDILSIQQFGRGTLAEIKSRCEFWVDRVAENLAPAPAQ